jgi:YD repeat-containing protein
MRSPSVSRFFVLLTSLCWLILPLRSDARTAPAPRSSGEGGGIREVIPDKYKERYLEWKNEFLSTEVGRSEWGQYEHNGRLTLTIIVSGDDRHGAGTSKYKWNDAGELVAATITLGSRINEGYPNPIYYPVMNALLPLTESYAVGDSVLAAAKIAHEFGHVRQATSVDGGLYRLQNQLMPAYNQILLANGRDVRDPRLVELARRMGGTPVEIWESREYWGEVNAMLFLRERITDQGEQRALCNRVRRTVELYAKDYAERFDQVTQ